jgi:hypothetical protein
MPPGTIVLCIDFSTTRSNKRLNKLSSTWTGPWIVLSQWSKVGATIKRIGSDEIRRAHVNQLKMFEFCKTTPREMRKGREPKKPTEKEQEVILRKLLRNYDEADDDGPTSDAEAGSDGEEYELESINGHFHNHHGFWFLVKYQNYQGLFWEHNSVLQAPKLVTKYFK